MIMYAREAEQMIRKINKTFPVLLVTGPKQVGKTTLLSNLKPQNMEYITLDDEVLRTQAQEDPKLFLEEHPAPLLIDEVQYAPRLFSYIKINVDKEQKNGMYWLTGSQQFHLMNNVSESLAGRVGIINLNSFTYSEIKRVKIPDTMGKKFEETNLLFDLFAPSPWTKLYRTIFLKKNHLLFQEIPSCNDWSLAYTALACAKKISVIRRPLLYYRSQISSSISSNRFRRTGDIVQAIKHLKHELKKRNLFDRYKEGFGRRSANHLIYEAFGGRRWGGFYILFRNLVIVNDYFVYKAFLCEVVKRLEKLLNNFFN